ncbi:MAG: UvrD-helicase domain-containing protein [Bacteroidales bacterium]|nr:UvrD-helicase domain-containing protein [Bacteroidales bacterium]
MSMPDPSFLILKAGAGSGKTFNLVKHYLLMAFNTKSDTLLRQRFRSILAITFTNKAAGEMRDRILKALVSISSGQMDDLANMICNEMSITPAELQRRAKIVCSAVLHNYSDLSICTIDSFMVRVVRTFAHDLNLSSNFEVELDNKYLAGYIVDTMMNLVGTQNNEALTKIVCAYAKARMNEAKNNNVVELLKTSAEHLFKENSRKYVDLLSNHQPDDFLISRENLWQSNAQYENNLKALAVKALSAADTQALEEKDFPGKSKGIYHFVEQIAATGKPLANKTLSNILERQSIIPNNATDATSAALSPVDGAFMDVLNYMRDGQADYNTRCALIGNTYNVALLGIMRKIETDYFRDNEITNLTEVSHKVSDEVKNQPAPFLFERLGERYHHFLIDEFQDTSKEQWHNLLPLIIGGVSEKKRSLVVGDAKQAIYRFRQGDVKQFIDLPHVEPNGEQNVVPHSNLLELPGISFQEPLSVNYRSRETIVGFNNKFFSKLVKRDEYAANDLLQRIYIGENTEKPSLWQEHRKKGGYVEATFCKREEMLSKVADIVQNLHDGLGYAYGDITILADRKNFLSEIATNFGAKGLRVASSESTLLASSIAVRLVRCLLKQMLNPSDKANNMLVDYYRCAIGAPKDIVPPLLYSLNLYDLVEELLRRYNVQAIDSAMCASLLNYTSHYCTTHTQSLAEFVDYLDDKWDDMATNAPSDPGAVKLMTVHKSKGLQCPAIIYYLPLATPRSNQLWVDVDAKFSLIEVGLVQLKQDENTRFDKIRTNEANAVAIDEINRRYVALTRAEEALFLLCERPRNESNLSFQQQVLTFMQEEATASKMPEETPDNDLSAYFMGELAFRHKPAMEKEVLQTSFQALSFPSWKKRLLIAKQNNELIDGAHSHHIRRGLQIHAILSETRSHKDLVSVVNRYAMANDLPNDDRNGLLEQLMATVSHPDCERFFNPDNTVITELPLMFDGHELRPDRVAIAKEATYVVDFKTGAPSALYADQVKKYCHAIAEMGYRNVLGYLLYIGETIHVEQVY